MNFTVLGSRGFIGRHLVAALKAAGRNVAAPDDPAQLTGSHGHILYCIGLTADFRSRPFDTMRAHVSVLGDILEKASFDSLVYLSSTRVYARCPFGRENAPITADAHDPSDLYNISKLAGESLCLSSGRKNVKIARLSNVVGYDPASENFLTALIKEALSGSIELRSDPASSKDYIALDDVVSLLPKIAVDGSQTSYNVANGVNITHRAIAERLARLTGCRVTYADGAPRHDFPAIDNSRIRGEFGFAPVSVLDILPTLIEQYRKPISG